MAQYLSYTDPVTGLTYREGVRDYSHIKDGILTPLGFDGIENTDWENIETWTPEIIVPVNFTVEEYQGYSFILRWLLPSGSVSIEKSEDSGQTWTTIAVVNPGISEYVDSDVLYSSAVQYSYRIRSFKGNRFSAYTDIINFSFTSLSKLLGVFELENKADGIVPNNLDAGVTFLTVIDDTPGAETFQCPNTSPFINADTDFIWFNSEGTQRTPTTLELISYDFQKTPVKYDDESPNALRIIVIVKANESFTWEEINNITEWLELPIMWSGQFNDFGHQKSNRSFLDQSVWVPEPSFNDIVTDGDTVGWFDYLQASTITKDGSDRVGQWNDALGSGRNLVQANDANKPLLTASGVLFDGGNDFMRVADFPYVQPHTVYLVLKQITYAAADMFVSARAPNILVIYQVTSEGNIAVNATGSNINTAELALNVYGIITSVINGANSSIQANDGTINSGSAGSGSFNGIVIGGRGDGLANFANFELKEAIFRKVSDLATIRQIVKDKLKVKHSLTY